MKKLLTVSFLVMLIFSLSCKKETVTIPDEPLKSIEGNWKIIKALRNGTDLTNRFDFSKFRISFTDKSYAVSNAVPFLVSKDGEWSFDDPVYPFKMSFVEQGKQPVTSTIQYPVVKGVRNIIISFSPGCTLNTYQYTLQKAD